MDRGWSHHVLIRGETSALPKRSFAMTDQPRTVSLRRVDRHSGVADDRTVREVEQWLRDFCGL